MDDVLTLDIPQGTTNFYTSSISASVKKLVKVGAGEAVLETSSPDFAGRVEIREGTLRVTSENRLGKASPIEVTGDAATLCLRFYSSTTFAGHNITIRGRGVGGGGALTHTRSASDKNPTEPLVIDTLTLSGDATLGVSSPFGVSKALTLNGHVLARVAGEAEWRLNPKGLPSDCTIDAGVISNASGRVSFRTVTPQFASPDDTTLFVSDSDLYDYLPAPPIPCRVVFDNATLTSNSHNINRGTLAGPVEIRGKGLTLTANETARYLQVCGTTTASAPLVLRGPCLGCYHLNGPFSSTASLDIREESNLILSSNVTRKAKSLLLRDGSRACLFAGSLDVASVTAGGDVLILQTNGAFRVRGPAVFGDLPASHASFLQESGKADFDDSVTLGAASGAQGILLTSGGETRLAGARIGAGGLGLVAVRSGAQLVLDGNAELAPAAGGSGALAVIGAGSSVSAKEVRLGVVDAASGAVLALTDGGTLRAERLLFAGDPVTGARREAYADGGCVRPTCGGEWKGSDAGSEGWVVGPNGLTVDTDEVADGEEVVWSCALRDLPSGGLASISLPSKVPSVRGPSLVEITGPSGSGGAWALAEYAPTRNGPDGKLTGVTVLALGGGYVGTPKAKACLVATNGTTKTACTVAVRDAAPGGGRLVKRGKAPLTLRCANACTGGMVVEEGLLALSDADAFPSDTPLEVRRGATFSGGNRAVRVSILSGSGALAACDVTVSRELRVDLGGLTAAAAPLSVAGTVSFAEGARVRIKNPENLPRPARGEVVLLRATGGITGAVPTLAPETTGLADWAVARRGTELRLRARRGLIFIMR